MNFSRVLRIPIFSFVKQLTGIAGLTKNKGVSKIMLLQTEEESHKCKSLLLPKYEVQIFCILSPKLCIIGGQ